MLSRKTYFALGLIGIQVILLVVLGLRSGPRKRKEVLGPIVADQISKISITKDKSAVLLQLTEEKAKKPTGTASAQVAKTKKIWRLLKPVAALADQGSVKSLLRSLERMQVGDLISRKRSWHKDKFGVDDKTGSRFELKNKDGKVIAQFILGKFKNRITFFRKPGEDAVYQALGIPKYAFDKTPQQWRDKTIFDFKQDMISKLEITHPKGKTVLVDLESKAAKIKQRPAKKKWKALLPAGIKLEQNSVNRLASSLSKLRTRDFSDTKDVKKCGLEKPEGMIKATLKNGQVKVLLIGMNKNKNDRYVKRPDRETIFIIGKWKVDNIYKAPDGFKRRKQAIPRVEPELARRITISKKGQPTVELARSDADKAWMVVKPFLDEANHNSVQQLLSQVENWTVPGYGAGRKKDHAKFQVDSAAGTFVRIYGSGAKLLSGFVVGKSERGATYLRKIDSDKVHRAHRVARHAFVRKPTTWRNRQILNFNKDDVMALNIVRATEDAFISNNSGIWSFERPSTGPADSKKMEALAGTLSRLWAASFIDGKGLAETGLDKPSLKLTVYLKGNKTQTLLVGGKSKKGGYFAMRQGRKTIYNIGFWTMNRIDKKSADLKEASGGAPGGKPMKINLAPGKSRNSPYKIKVVSGKKKGAPFNIKVTPVKGKAKPIKLIMTPGKVKKAAGKP